MARNARHREQVRGWQARAQEATCDAGRRGEPWTEAEDKVLWENWNEDRVELARRMGRTYASVIARRWKLNKDMMERMGIKETV